MRKGYEHFDRIFDQQDEIIKLSDILLKKQAELLEEMKQFEKHYYSA